MKNNCHVKKYFGNKLSKNQKLDNSMRLGKCIKLKVYRITFR